MAKETVRALNGATFRFTQKEMIQTRAGGEYPTLSRGTKGQVRRGLREHETVFFHKNLGEPWKNGRLFLSGARGYRNIPHNTGEISLGCMVFGKTAAKKIRKWAGV